MMRQHLGIGGRVIYVISQFYETGRCACDLVGFPQRNEEEKLRVYDFRYATCTRAGSIFRADFEGFKGLQSEMHACFSRYFCVFLDWLCLGWLRNFLRFDFFWWFLKIGFKKTDLKSSEIKKYQIYILFVKLWIFNLSISKVSLERQPKYDWICL